MVRLYYDMNPLDDYYSLDTENLEESLVELGRYLQDDVEFTYDIDIPKEEEKKKIIVSIESMRLGSKNKLVLSCHDHLLL